MLIQMLFNQPQMLGPILKNTPTYVWGLLATLTAMGLGQIRARSASFARITVMPVAMTALSLWGTLSALGSSPQLGYVLAAYAAGTSVASAFVASTRLPTGTRYDAASRTFMLPGSWVPMLLILCIFLTKYIVGVDLAMRPALAHDGLYTIVVGALYGLFSGIFAGRAARLWRMASRPASRITTAGANA